MSTEKFARPSLAAASEAWGKCLASHGLPTDSLWIFAENLCIEPATATPGNFHFGFQTKFARPDDDAFEIAYDHFSDTDARLVFYRLGSSEKKSVCILLCDSWFEGKNPRDGFERRDDWNISFHPGHAGEIEEITDLTRWVRRVKRNRAFHDFDFSMSLETIEEIKQHGRTLAPYERFADKMIGRLRTVLG